MAIRDHDIDVEVRSFDGVVHERWHDVHVYIFPRNVPMFDMRA